MVVCALKNNSYFSPIILWGVELLQGGSSQFLNNKIRRLDVNSKVTITSKGVIYSYWLADLSLDTNLKCICILKHWDQSFLRTSKCIFKNTFYIINSTSVAVTVCSRISFRIVLLCLFLLFEIKKQFLNFQLESVEYSNTCVSRNFETCTKKNFTFQVTENFVTVS